jgi:hypothetical protein
MGIGVRIGHRIRALGRWAQRPPLRSQPGRTRRVGPDLSPTRAGRSARLHAHPLPPGVDAHGPAAGGGRCRRGAQGARRGGRTGAMGAHAVEQAPAGGRGAGA